MHCSIGIISSEKEKKVKRVIEKVTTQTYDVILLFFFPVQCKYKYLIEGVGKDISSTPTTNVSTKSTPQKLHMCVYVYIHTVTSFTCCNFCLIRFFKVIFSMLFFSCLQCFVFDPLFFYLVTKFFINFIYIYKHKLRMLINYYNCCSFSCTSVIS